MIWRFVLEIPVDTGNEPWTAHLFHIEIPTELDNVWERLGIYEYIFDSPVVQKASQIESMIVDALVRLCAFKEDYLEAAPPAYKYGLSESKIAEAMYYLAHIAHNCDLFPNAQVKIVRIISKGGIRNA